MQIVLFGGAFDPPHLGHQQITQTLLDQHFADQVWYVPTKEHPFAKSMTAAKHRLAMLKMIINDDRIKLEEYELHKEGVSYSRDTLDELAQQYPDDTFSWVIGSDNLQDFHKWEDSQGRDYLDLLKHYRFYVYPRQGFPMQPLYDNMYPLANMPEVVVSSTEIKKRIGKEKDFSDLVDPQVEQYISDHALYNG